MIYEYKDLPNLDFFNTTYKIKLKGYYYTFNKEAFLLEVHEEIYLLEDFKKRGFALTSLKFKDLIMEIEDQETLYKLNEEITLDEIIDKIGPIIKDENITFNKEYEHKLIDCNESELMRHLFDIDYVSTHKKTHIGTGMSRFFVKPNLLDPKSPTIITDPKGELGLKTEELSPKIKIKKVKLD